MDYEVEVVRPKSRSKKTKTYVVEKTVRSKTNGGCIGP